MPAADVWTPSLGWTSAAPVGNYSFTPDPSDPGPMPGYGSGSAGGSNSGSGSGYTPDPWTGYGSGSYGSGSVGYGSGGAGTGGIAGNYGSGSGGGSGGVAPDSWAGYGSGSYGSGSFTPPTGGSGSYTPPGYGSGSYTPPVAGTGSGSYTPPSYGTGSGSGSGSYTPPPVALGPVSITLTTSADAVQQGDLLTVVVDVWDGSGSGRTPTGAVSLNGPFESPSVALPEVEAGHARATFTFAAVSAPAGNYTVAANYNGDSTFALLSNAGGVPLVVVEELPPAFAKLEDVIATFEKNKDASALLGQFKIDGGTVVSGDATTVAKIIRGEKSKIVLEPKNLRDESEAVSALLFELVRWKNTNLQQAIYDKVKAGTLSPEDGAVASERLSYGYMTDHQALVQAATKAKDWNLTTDRVKAVLDQSKSFEDFLSSMKKSGHYGRMETQLKAMAPKK